MPLQKKSDPLTRAGVAGYYIEKLTVDVAADAIGLKPSTLYSAANPDQEYVLPDINYYLTLDKACVEAGHIAPFARWYLHKIGGSRAADDLTDAMLDLHSLAGKATDVIRCAQDPDSPGGSAITFTEKAEIKQAVVKVQEVLEGICGAVDGGGD